MAPVTREPWDGTYPKDKLKFTLYALHYTESREKSNTQHLLSPIEKQVSFP